MAGNLARGSLPHALGVSVTQSLVMSAANTPVDKKRAGRPSTETKPKRYNTPAKRSANDIEAAFWAMGNVQKFLAEKREECRGNPDKALQGICNALSCAFLHQGKPPEGLGRAFKRVTGFSNNMIENAETLRKSECITPQQFKKPRKSYVVLQPKSYVLPRAPHSRGSKKFKPKMWIWEWFHSDANILVTEDKTRPEVLKGKNVHITIDGIKIAVKCSKKFMLGTKKDMVQGFLSSGQYKQHLKNNPGDTFSEPDIRKCICPCMKKARVNECSCKTCSEFEAVILAWHEQRQKWHKEETCRCKGCSDPEKFKRYMSASTNVQEFRQACLCKKTQFPLLSLPHTPDIVPEFRSIKCCKYSKTIPKHVEPCTECGVNKRLYQHDDACVERTHGEATWKQWAESEVDALEKKGGKDFRLVFREVTGTRRRLLDRIFELAPAYFFHWWVHTMTRHMGRLRNSVFDGIKTIQVKVDFAASVELRSEKMFTCEFARNTHQYVAIVQYSPGEFPMKPGILRQTQTDVWRYFTCAKPGAMVHQRVLQDIAKHYKKLIPTLERMEIECDGCSHQFKGRFNFWIMGGGMFSSEDYAGVESVMCHTAPGHGGGAVDGYGKVPAAWLNNQACFGRTTAYNYWTAYEMCRVGLKNPSKDRSKVQGLWGCNGFHHWGALSNGFDEPGRLRKYPVVPKFTGGDVTVLPGSKKDYYTFRPKPGNNRDELTGGKSLTMQARFINCACPFCREGGAMEEHCPYQDEFGKWNNHVMKRVGGVVSDGTAVSDRTRGVDGEPCEFCGGTAHTELPVEIKAKATAVTKMTVTKRKDVMMVCSGCASAWHIKCVPHQGKGTRRTVPLTGTWMCPKCAAPCETCDDKDVFDDAKKRMLRCRSCSKSVHMHCLNTPLEEEPDRSWRCSECENRRVVTRLMSSKAICAHCHEYVQPGTSGCRACSYCSKVWHTLRTCLQSHQLPPALKTGKKGRQPKWRCPECAV